MALFFSTTTDVTYEVAVTCDPALDMTEEEKTAYLRTGEGLKILEGKKPTLFLLKPLSPSLREQAEIKAGALKKSELGRLLYSEEPSDVRKKAYWRESLSEQERNALSSYELYINNVYKELILASIIGVKEAPEGEVWSLLEKIRPDQSRIRTISELVLHIQRVSLVSAEGE